MNAARPNELLAFKTLVREQQDKLRPLVDELKRHVLTAEKLHADDTPVPVLDPGSGADPDGTSMDLRARRPAVGR